MDEIWAVKIEDRNGNIFAEDAGFDMFSEAHRFVVKELDMVAPDEEITITIEKATY